MKKLLVIALLLSVGLMANAQGGGWRITHREADPMKGQTEQDVYIYDVLGMGTLVVWDWNEPDFRLITEKGFFKFSTYGPYTTVGVKVGFFDDNDNMEKMVYLTLSVEPNHNWKYITTDIWGRKKIKKILSRLRSGKGYVRFVAQRYDDSDFDMKVEPYNE